MKPLSRAFTRLVLLFFALGIFFLAVNELIPYRTLGDRYRVMDTAYWIKNTLRITGIVLLVNGGIQWVRNLRCPYCGRGYAMPWWRKGKSTSVTGAAGKLSLMTRRTQPKNAKGSRAP